MSLMDLMTTEGTGFTGKIRQEICELEVVAKAYAPQEIRGCLEQPAQSLDATAAQRVDAYLTQHFGVKLEMLQR